MEDLYKPWPKEISSKFLTEATFRNIHLNFFRSVFVTYEPTKISLHNFYEFVWLLKTGIPRMLRILAGTEQFVYDTSILKEGYQHYTP